MFFAQGSRLNHGVAVCPVRQVDGHSLINADDERQFIDWQASYAAACAQKATCELLAVGNGDVHPSLLPLVALHDRETRALSRLALA